MDKESSDKEWEPPYSGNDLEEKKEHQLYCTNMQYRAHIPTPLVSPILQYNRRILYTYMCKDQSLYMINMVIHCFRHKESSPGLMRDRRDTIHYTMLDQINVCLILVMNIKAVHYHSINKHHHVFINCTNMLHSVLAYMIA